MRIIKLTVFLFVAFVACSDGNEGGNDVSTISSSVGSGQSSDCPISGDSLCSSAKSEYCKWDRLSAVVIPQSCLQNECLMVSTTQGSIDQPIITAAICVTKTTGGE